MIVHVLGPLALHRHPVPEFAPVFGRVTDIRLSSARIGFNVTERPCAPGIGIILWFIPLFQWQMLASTFDFKLFVRDDFVALPAESGHWQADEDQEADEEEVGFCVVKNHFECCWWVVWGS